MLRVNLISLSFIVLFLLFNVGNAQIPKTISYQGVLTDANGTVVPNGNYNLTFKIYSVSSGGTELWSEMQIDTVVNGIFNVILGIVNSLNLPFDHSYWLGVSIDGGVELSPRVALTAAAYSLNASSVEDSAVTGSKIANGSVVRSINGITDQINLMEGENITIHQSGDSIAISATGGVGSNTLDEAYDQGGPGAGRTINADAGPVHIAGPNGLTVSAWVGIGTNAPQHPLHVKGFFELEGSDFLMVDSSRGDGGRALVHWGPGTDDQMILNWGGDFEEGVRVQGSKVVVDGNLGIGTPNPTQRLEVADTIYSSFGGFKFPDGSVQTSASAGGGLWSQNGSDIYYNSGKVGIGNSNPFYKFEVSDDYTNNINPVMNIKRTGFGSASPLRFTGPSGDFYNIGITQNSEFGISGLNSNIGLPSDVLTISSGRVGIGTLPASAQLQVASNRRYAGYFTSDSLDWETHVIHAEYTGSDLYNATAVYGKSVPGDYYGYGGFFEGGQCGVRGEVHPTGNLFYYGVIGHVNGGSGYNKGVSGFAYSNGINYGLYGRAAGLGTNYGIYAEALDGATNWAGYFAGDVRVTGIINNTAGASKIDHPLEPQNKYLSHSIVGSPDMMNVYNGNVSMDVNGEAWVQLPSWFEVLNKDFRYQLTCIGSFAPVYIAEKISNNRFKISGGKPGMEVSWQVTGIRHDPFAEKNRIPVEEMKSGEEIGKYLHPDAYGVPETMGINYNNKENMKR